MRKGRRYAGSVVVTIVLSSLCWISSGSAPATAAPQGEIAEATDAVPGQYIVTLRPVSGAEVAPTTESLAAEHSGRILFTYRDALQGFAVAMSEADALALSQEPGVARVEENGVVRASATQAAPPWGLDRVDQGDLTPNGSYKYGNTGAGVRAYVIDTGIRRTHTQFGGRVSTGFSAVRDGRGSNDCNGHGTHVAGTIGGSTYGVAKAVRIVPVRVLNCNNTGTYARILAGVDWVTGHAVRPAVVNMSLGGFGASQSLEAAVARSIRRGLVYVISAGNDGVDACLYTPARVPQAITVGASDDTDTLASFSNGGSCVDLVAPGVDIRSAGHTSNTATRRLSGTSMAAPHVAGVIARYLQRNPAASPATASAALLDNSLIGRVGNARGPNRLLYSRFLDGVLPPLHPANDAFANATPITGTTGQIVGGNRTATSEVGETWCPIYGCNLSGAAAPARQSVWYRWTAPVNGQFLFSTCSSDQDFDNTLAIFEGSGLNTLTHAADGGTITCGTQLRGLVVSVQAGHVYSVVVDGSTADPSGWFRLQWLPS